MRPLRERNLPSAREAARVIEKGHVTVLRWVRSGLIEAHWTPGGHVRIRREALVALLRERKMPVPAAPVERNKVLVIDDAPIYFDSRRALLRQKDKRIDFSGVTSGHAGLLEVGTDRPDAVLLDAHMPGLDGMTTCRLLRGNTATASIPIIAISGRGEDDGERMLAAGATTYLPRPFTASEVVEQLVTVGVMPPPAPAHMS